MSEAFDASVAVAYGDFILSAYAMYQAAPNSLRPAPLNIPTGYTLAAWVTMTDFGFGGNEQLFYGYLAVDDSDPTSFVLAFRGTSTALEWWDNAHVFFTSFKNIANGGNVSLGFDTIYRTMQVQDVNPGAARLAVGISFAEQIASLVQTRTALSGARVDMAKLVVTGHSLGGALATLYVADNAINQKIPIPTVCTFASPRVGDAAFVAAYNSIGLTSWRIVNKPDLVPNVPPDVFGYSHVDALEIVDSSGVVADGVDCAHAMETYEHMLDSSRQLRASCVRGAQRTTPLLAPAAAETAAREAPLAESTTLSTPSIVINLNISPKQ